MTAASVRRAPSAAPLDDRIRLAVRAELHRSHAWQMPGSPPPMLADVFAERTLLATVVAGFGEAGDLESLGAEHFVDRRTGMLFELYASSLRGGPAFRETTIVGAVAKLDASSTDVVQAWLETIRALYPVCLVPSVAEQARRVLELAAWRRFFDAMANLADDTRHAAGRGVALPAAVGLRRALDALNVDLRRGAQ